MAEVASLLLSNCRRGAKREGLLYGETIFETFCSLPVVMAHPIKAMRKIKHYGIAKALTQRRY